MRFLRFSVSGLLLFGFRNLKYFMMGRRVVVDKSRMKTISPKAAKKKTKRRMLCLIRLKM